MIDYEGKRFRAVANSSAGQVDGDTVFEYHQVGDVVWATYAGGSIKFGTLVSAVSPDGALDMRYQHVSREGSIYTGRGRSRPEVLSDGRLRLYETWEWTSGRSGSGESIVEEI